MNDITKKINFFNKSQVFMKKYYKKEKKIQLFRPTHPQFL